MARNQNTLVEPINPEYHLPFIFGNDVDSIDVATRVAMVKYKNVGHIHLKVNYAKKYLWLIHLCSKSFFHSGQFLHVPESVGKFCRTHKSHSTVSTSNRNCQINLISQLKAKRL